jgi:hypothetical protein
MYVLEQIHFVLKYIALRIYQRQHFLATKIKQCPLRASLKASLRVSHDPKKFLESLISDVKYGILLGGYIWKT